MDRVQYEENFAFESTCWWFLGRRKIVNNLVKKYFKAMSNSMVLDMGCGTGLFLNDLRKYGQPIGIDCSPIALAFTKKRGWRTLVHGDICSLPFKSESFDLVTVLGVLYNGYVKDDTLAIQEGYRVLKKGGIIVIDEAAYHFLQSRHNERVDGIRRFSRKELIHKCEKNRLKILKSSYWNVLMLPIFSLVILLENIFLFKEGSRLRKLPTMVNSLLTAYLSLEAFLIQYCNFSCGPSIIVVGKKTE